VAALHSDNNLKRWVGISLIIHIVLLSIATYLGRTPYIKREFYAPVYKVDLVTLEQPEPLRPKTAKQAETKKPVSKAVPKPPATPKPVKTLPVPGKKAAAKKNPTGLKARKKPAKKEIATPVDPDAAINALKKRHEEDINLESKLEELRAAIAARDKRGQNAANDVSSGPNSLPPASKAGLARVDSIEMDQLLKEYYNSLWEKIRRSWILPGASESYRGMKAIISVKISGSGELLKVWIEEGSGNSFFDESAIRAVKKSAPFPGLPDSKKDGDEVGFRFTPDQ